LFARHYAKKVTDDWMLPFDYRNYQTPDAYMNGMGFGGLGQGGDRGFYEEHVGEDKEDVATLWQRRNTLHGKRAWDWGINYGNIITHTENGVDYSIYNDAVYVGYCERVGGEFTFDSRDGEGYFHYLFIVNGDVKAFMYYRNIHFKIPFICEKRLRLKLGWDLWTMSYWPMNTPRMFCCSVGIHSVK